MEELAYKMVDGYRVPDLAEPQAEEAPLGKYGYMRRKFLQAHHYGLYLNLLTQGKLDSHLREIQEAAQRRVDELTAHMAKAQGVNEELKARDQMKWVGQMNNILHRAEEIVKHDLLYV